MKSKICYLKIGTKNLKILIKTIKQKNRFVWSRKIVLIVFTILFNILSMRSQDVKYLGNYPDAAFRNWTHNFQGISNNDSYWYFTTKRGIWKIPLSFNLNNTIFDLISPTPDELKNFVIMPTVLKNMGYNNFGDSDNFEGFLFVPIKGNNINPVIAVFDEDDLKFIDYYEIRNIRAEWCSINPITKNLYTSDLSITSGRPIYVYNIDWEELKINKKLVLNQMDSYKLDRNVTSDCAKSADIHQR